MVTIITTGAPTPQLPPFSIAAASVTPLPYTRMPLFEWASRVGLNPIHFGGGVMSGRFMKEADCSAPWPRYTWQDGGANLSHTDLALSIATAENLIEEYLGYHVAPRWRKETHSYPRRENVYRTYGVNLTGRRPAIQMERGKILSVTHEAREYIGTFPVYYQDLDGDGYGEVAYVLVAGGADIDTREIALFPVGMNDHPSWQIRYPKRWGNTGDDTYFLIDCWLMFDPEILARIPGEFYIPLDANNPANLIQHVDAYRVYEETTSAVSLSWEDGSYCFPDGSSELSTTGIVRNPEVGLIAPTWGPGALSGRMTPDLATINYYSGAQSREYISGYTLDPLGGHLADAVFYLSAARATRDLCGCAESRALVADMRTDMSLVSPQGNFLAVADAIQTAPFGTRRGEWLAYKSLTLLDKHMEVAVF